MVKKTIAVVGLGYVGLPVAVAFSKNQKVIAFDISESRIHSLQQGVDHTGEIEPAALRSPNFLFTSDPQDLSAANFFIVAVPTPIDKSNQPDLSPLLSASKIIAPQLKKGDIVVYESTVYPGATEEKCVPVLEKYSHLKCGKDFFVGYSPERINPGDKDHTFTKIQKVVSGQTPEILEIVAEVYGNVVEAGVYRAPSIKVAEAAKVIENTQRDLNIAFVNELAMIFHQLGIDTNAVLAAAGTKWNFLSFKPGLVGGHCIGVDPYYLTHKAESVGFHPQVILAGRRVNDGMGKYIVEQAIKLLAQKGVLLKGARVGILGLSFKENCPDLRNTKVVDIISELKEYGVTILVHDPIADPADAKREYGLNLSSLADFSNLDAVILAVAHDAYRLWSLERFLAFFKKEGGLLLDVKSVLPEQTSFHSALTMWRL